MSLIESVDDQVLYYLSKFIVFIGQTLKCYQCPCDYSRKKTYDELCIEDGDYDYGIITTCSINMTNPVCMMLTKSKFSS